jgi:serine/threonine protein kinase
MTSSTYRVYRLVKQEMITIQRRPANVLLSERQVPVLVDFGFAEKYDLENNNAFLSNLTYGTPEVCCLSSIRV